MKILPRALFGCFAAVIGLMTPGKTHAGEATNSAILQPGKEIEITFSDTDLPPTLYSMMNDEVAQPA